MRMCNLLAAIVLGAASLTAAAATEERALRKEALVSAPVAEVWKAWTTREGLQGFFAPEAIVEPRPGGRFSIHFNPYAKEGLKGADDMRILAVQPEKMLSFTWNAPPHLPEARAQRTVVIVRMEPAPENQTQVRLTQVGWGDGGQWDEAFNYFDKAWGNVLAGLQKRFAGKPADWTQFLKRMKEYEDSQQNK